MYLSRYRSIRNDLEFISLANDMNKTKVIAVTIILLLSISKTTEREILRLGVFNDLRGLVPAMEIALETIKNDKTLPFTFEVTLNFTMVSQFIIAR